jgi:hypothetical protein
MLLCFRRLIDGALLPCLALLALTGVGGCEPQVVYPDAAGADAGPPPLSLRIATVGPVGLPFGSSAIIEVELTDGLGTPQAGETISFALEGTTADTSLGALDGMTDERGRATVQLTAGERTSSFRLRANHPLSSPAWIDITVAASFGRLVVQPSYEGERPVERWGITVFRGGDCSAARVATEGGFRRVISGADGEVRYDALATDVTYTVLVRGYAVSGGMDRVTAIGCTMGVGVLADRETTVVIPASSAELMLGGAYEVVVNLDTTAAITAPLEDFVLDAESRVGSANDDGARMLDALTLVLASDVDGLAALTRLRAAGAEDAIATLLIDDDSAPSSYVGPVLRSAASALYDLRAEAFLDVLSGDVPGFTVRRIVAASRSASPLTLALDPAGATVLIAATFLPGDDQLVLDRLSVPVRLGASLQAVLEAQAGASLDGVDALFGSAPCESLATFVGADTELASACDGACVALACEAVLATTLALALSETTSLDTSFARLELAGSIEVRDIDGDLAADTLRGSLEGSYVDEAGAGDGVVLAELSGARSID